MTLIPIDTLSGLKEVRRAGDSSRGHGRTGFFPCGDNRWRLPFGRDLTVYPVSTGNPHGVVFVDDLDEIDLMFWDHVSNQPRLAPWSQHRVYAVLDDSLQACLGKGSRTHFARGTGACAVAAVAAKQGLT